MKTLRIILPFLFLCASLHAAAPRFYVTGQIGRFEADAGTVDDAGYYVMPAATQNTIKSGTKTFRDFSLGAEFNRRFSLEAGYAHFNAFSSPQMNSIPPNVNTVVAVRKFYQIYHLQAYRLTPVLHFPITERLKLDLLGGLTYSTSRTISREFPPPFTTYTDTETTHTKASYHLGLGLNWDLTHSTVLGARFMHYDFGKIHTGFRQDVSGNRITAMTYSLGLSWRF